MDPLPFRMRGGVLGDVALQRGACGTAGIQLNDCWGRHEPIEREAPPGVRAHGRVPARGGREASRRSLAFSRMGPE
jgi:hypothetical protein